MTRGTHPGASGSLREGLPETLTVLRLDVPGTQFRRVNGHLHLPNLRTALEAEVTGTVGPVCHDDTVNVA